MTVQVIEERPVRTVSCSVCWSKLSYTATDVIKRIEKERYLGHLTSRLYVEIFCPICSEPVSVKDYV
jgi:hypothetical protein